MDHRQTRQTLVSSGIHLGAVRRLGASYTAAEYLVAVEAARDAGDGERYADAVLGADVDELLRGVEDDGGDAVRAAEQDLRDRGIHPDAASFEQYRAALVRASS